MRRFATVIMATALAATLVSCSADADAPSATGGTVTDLQIIVPAEPGGGWDQTGRSISQALTTESIVATAPVRNIGGAGGNVGLASLANETDPHTIMVTGLVMVGAVETNAGQNRMEETTPIARLTEEALVVVVPSASKYNTLEDLVEDIVANGQDVSVTGGSAGGADHILAGLLLADAGLDGAEISGKLNYIPNSGGGEAVALILGNNASAAISGVGEFVEHIEAGTMKALAVSSVEPIEILSGVPTITEAGYDVVLTNWRGILAPAGISTQDRAALEDTITQLHRSEAWTTELETRGWTDAFLMGDDFRSYLTGNIAEVQGTLRNIGLVD